MPCRWQRWWQAEIGKTQLRVESQKIEPASPLHSTPAVAYAPHSAQLWLESPPGRWNLEHALVLCVVRQPCEAGQLCGLCCRRPSLCWWLGVLASLVGWSTSLGRDGGRRSAARLPVRGLLACPGSLAGVSCHHPSLACLAAQQLCLTPCSDRGHL